ncbi:MAG: tetratricopeptide repeat protein [Anaerolineaceae bacterium]|jgi:hypothetical protein|nr:tetratricopeptide repeat protein [Anaerolineaceae bacterium]
MTRERINQAIQLIREGNTKTAGKILSEVVKQEPKNETAWLWLAGCFEENEKKKFCLKKALEINPKNQKAWDALNRLSQEELAWQDRLDVALEQDTKLEIDPGFNMNDSVYGENPFNGEGISFEGNGSYADSVPRGAELFETLPDPSTPKEDESQFENTKSFTGIFIVGSLAIIGVIVAAVYILISQGILFPPSAEKIYAKEMRSILSGYNAWENDVAAFNTAMNGPYSGVLSATGGTAMSAQNALFAYLALLAEPSEEISPSAARNELNALLGPVSTTAYQSGTALLTALQAADPPDKILAAHQGFYACVQQETRRVEAVNQIVTSGVRTGFSYSTAACETQPENLSALQKFTREH